MSKTKVIVVGTCAAALMAAAMSLSLAQETPKAGAEPPKGGEGGDVARYCASVAPVAAEARMAWEAKRLNELEAQVKQRLADLDAKETEAREWVGKREAMLKKADDDIIAIYSKMKPEAAAAQMMVMDEEFAAAILSKLNPRAASTVLNEMDATRASKLTDLMSGTAAADGKKS